MKRRTIALVLVLCLFVPSCLFQKEDGLSSIPLREGTQFSYVGDPLDKQFVEKHPWANFRPEPFQYKEDLQLAKEGKSIFVVGGINCPKDLADVETITGVTLADLNFRTQPNDSFFSISNLDPNFKFPNQWGNIANIGLRASREGFLAKGQEFKTLLQEDNQWVLSQNYSHQLLAEPLLLAIESFERSQKGNHAPKLNFARKTFSIKAKQMGGRGSVDVLKAISLQAEANKLQEKLDARRLSKASFEKKMTTIEAKKKQSLKWRSGWVGVGTQGSPFNDEIFADYVIELRDAKNQVALVFDAMTPHLIYRYGFYQGGRYRIDPKTIVSTFGIVGYSEAPCPS